MQHISAQISEGTSDVIRGEGPTEKRLPLIYVIKGLSKRLECTINSITEEIMILFSV